MGLFSKIQQARSVTSIDVYSYTEVNSVILIYARGIKLIRPFDPDE